MLKRHFNPVLFRLNGNKVGQQTSQHFQNYILKEITKLSQLDTFWISENLMLQQETTGPDGRKVSATIIFLKIWRNPMLRLMKRVLNSLHKTQFWITTFSTDVKQFFQKYEYYNYYPIEFEEFLQTPTFLLHFEIKLQRFRSNCFGQCCILLNISPYADISILKHNKAKF